VDTGKAAALTGGPTGAERRGEKEARARGVGRLGRKAEGAGEWASFLFLLFQLLFFPFLFIYSI
jgi:hypothetical protein